MNIFQNLHKSDDFLNICKGLSGTAVSEIDTQSSSTLLQKNKDNKQALEVQFKKDNQELQSRVDLLGREESSNENLDIVENSGRALFFLNIQKLNSNEDLSKIYQLGYWVQNNLTERPTHFIKTEDLYNSNKKTFKAYENKILTFDAFSKAIDKTMKMFSLNFTKKRLNGQRCYVGVDVYKRNSDITFDILIDKNSGFVLVFEGSIIKYILNQNGELVTRLNIARSKQLSMIRQRVMK